MDPLRLQALALSDGLASSPANIVRVAEATSNDAASWAFTQWSLRKRAQAKFKRASEMLFSREALEQASHEALAQYHASRFPSGTLVLDLTAGIGGDLIALASRGPAKGFELDPERAEMAAFNSGCEVSVGDCMSAPLDAEFAFADPSRRVEGKRVFDPSTFSPNPTLLAKRMGTLLLGGMKLSPILPDSYLESLGQCLEFVSFGGECREALVWVGTLAHTGRTAVRAETDGLLPSGPAPYTVDHPLDYLYEADPAAIRAHCLGTLCSNLGLVGLGDSNGYLTSRKCVESEWLVGYRVRGEAVGDLAKVKDQLQLLGGSTPVVKSRAAGVEVESVAKKLRSGGSTKLIVAAYQVGKSVRYVILEKL